MKTKRRALGALLLAFVLLCGCARSDVTLNIHNDGSFTADIKYGIDKSLMGSDEVKQQLTQIITQALDENDIPYTQSEDEDFVTISLSRDFKDLNQLTSAAAWKGISMVPRFSTTMEEGSLWVRIDDKKLKISGTLNSETFGAKEFVEQNSEVASGFGGSLSIVAENKITKADGGEATENNGYIWQGSSSDSKTVDFETEKLKLPEGYDEGIKPISPSPEDAEAPESEAEKSSVGVWIAVLAAAVIVVAVAVFLVKRKKRGDEKLPQEQETLD